MLCEQRPAIFGFENSDKGSDALVWSSPNSAGYNGNPNVDYKAKGLNNVCGNMRTLSVSVLSDSVKTPQ